MKILKICLIILLQKQKELFGQCEFERTPGDGDGQGDLACYNSWVRKELDVTE